MRASHRVIFNTGILYIKLLIVVIIGLVNTRLVLNALGETNYGIYSLVAGVVGMLAILNSAMSTASMRFMSHSLGSGDDVLISKTFNTTLCLHFIIGLIVVIFMEVGGLIMFKYILNIPAGKLFDAKVVFHFMVITTFVTIIAVPYDAVMNSHENMLALSIADIFGAILKLGIAIYLTYSSANLLILYGALMFVVQIILRLIKQWYSIVNYKECKINFNKFIDRSLAKTILSFSGWNLFGSIAAMSVTQIKSILLNMFFGVKLNAANGISMGVTSQVNMISTSMTRALNPQLVKSEGRGDRQWMLSLTEMATKFSVFLFALFAIPVLIEMPYLLNLWLKNVPDYAIIFSRLILIGLLIDKFSFEITTAIRAVGVIRNLTVIESIIIIFNVPVSYFLFKFSYPPPAIFIVNIFFTVLVFFERLYFGKVIAGLDVKQFIKNAVSPIIFPMLSATVLAFLLHLYMQEGILRMILVFILFVVTMVLLFWHFGLTRYELEKFKSIIFSGLTICNFAKSK